MIVLQILQQQRPMQRIQRQQNGRISSYGSGRVICITIVDVAVVVDFSATATTTGFLWDVVVGVTVALEYHHPGPVRASQVAKSVMKRGTARRR